MQSTHPYQLYATNLLNFSPKKNILNFLKSINPPKLIKELYEVFCKKKNLTKYES